MSTPLQLSPENLKAIKKLPRDLWYTASIELNQANKIGRVIGNLRAYVATADFRDLAEKQPVLTPAERRAGKVLPPLVKIPLDAESREGAYSFAETIAATDPAVTLDEIMSHRSRMEQLDYFSECAIDLFRISTREKSQQDGKTQRRHQQIKKAQIAKARSESDFSAGRKGQGGLFDFGGGVQS